MATDSITPKLLDIETLNQLAVALDDHADGIEQVTLHKLEQDIRTAARVASEMARWRFALAELAASLPAGNFARNQILKLLGKDMLESAEPDPVLAAADKARDAYQAWRNNETTELCDAYTAAQSALLEAKPTTLDGYFTKWRTFLHSERELGMDSLDFLPVMSQMVDEVAAVVTRCTRL
jgi:hypothetical protein